MNTFNTLALMAMTGIAAADTAADYVNFIRQTQADTPNIEWDVSVASSGETLSQEGVGAYGSFFQLWSIHSGTLAEYMLDEQYVSSYLPNASLVIRTGDPYTSVKRTRVDQPFSVTVVVEGLDDGTSGLDPSEIPEAAKKVAFARSKVLYDGSTHAPASGVVPTLVSDKYISTNGRNEFFYSITALTGSDLTQVEGEEIFTVTALEDFGVGQSTLDSRRLQIWPVATGTLSGIDTSREYNEIPEILVELQDLYPKSETYVRAYEGAPTSAPAAPFLIPASYVKIADAIPQDRDVTLSKLDKLEKFTAKEYTLEIIHETPFGYDILDRVYPLKLDRTIRMNVNLYSRGE